MRPPFACRLGMHKPGPMRVHRAYGMVAVSIRCQRRRCRQLLQYGSGEEKPGTVIRLREATLGTMIGYDPEDLEQDFRQAL